MSVSFKELSKPLTHQQLHRTEGPSRAPGFEPCSREGWAGMAEEGVILRPMSPEEVEEEGVVGGG